MTWLPLSDPLEVELLRQESFNEPILIFKHSTSCSISRTALSRLERNWQPEQVSNLSAYYLDILSFRNISNKVASDFGIEHQSPQILLLQNGKCIYTASHWNISFNDLQQQLSAIQQQQ